MNVKQQLFLGRITEDLAKRDFEPVTILELAKSIAAPPQAIKAVIEMGIPVGEIVNLGGGLFYGKLQFEKIVERLKRDEPTEGFDGAEFRRVSGLSRRLADILFQRLELRGNVDRVEDRWFIKVGPEEI